MKWLIVTIIISLFIVFISGCDSTFNKNFKESIKNISDLNEANFPEPQFDISKKDLIKEIISYSKVNNVNISRPTLYISKQEYDCWVRVSLLNPVIKSDKKSFSKEVASIIRTHLKNSTDFKKIEVSVTQKKGVGFTFSKTENFIFEIDSLGCVPKGAFKIFD
jgi:hypothetical protein